MPHQRSARRSLNGRLALMLIVGTIASFGALLGLHRVQARRSGAIFLKTAEKAASAGHLKEALRNYALYLRLEPNDAEARAGLGTLQAQLGDDEDAHANLEHALRLNPDDDAARLLLVEVAMRIQRYADARNHLDRLLKGGHDAQLLDLLGQCQAYEVDPSAAEASYRKAIELQPGQVDSYRRLGDLLRNQMGRADKADEILAELIQNNPNSARAYVIRGRQRLQAEDFENAFSDAAEALRLAPFDSEVLLFSARCAHRRGDLESAFQQAKDGLATASEVPDWYLLLADLCAQQGRVDEAHRWLRKGIGNVSRLRDVLASNLANSLLDEGAFEEAAAVVEVLRADESVFPPLLTYLDGRLAFARGQWLLALRRFEQARPEFLLNTDVLKQIDFWLGQCHGQLGSTDLQLTAYRRAVESDPFWARARQGVVSALMASGRSDEAFSELRQLVRLDNPPVASWLQLTRFAILRQLQHSGDDADWSEAEQLLEHCDDLLPEAPLVTILRAEILVGQDRDPEAIELLRREIDQAPQEAQLWTALLELALQQDDEAMAQQTLDEARSRLGDTVDIRLATARYRSRQTAPAAPDAMHVLAAEIEQFSPTEVAQLWRGLIALAWQLEDWPHAQELLTKLAALQPNNLQLWLLQFDLALKRKDGNRMQRVLAKVARIEGEGPLWHYGSAVRLRLLSDDEQSPVASRQLTQALRHLAQARSARPAWSKLAILAAEIQLLRGEKRAAMEQLSRAIDLGARDPPIIRQAAQMLYANSLYRKADQIIRLVEQQRTPFSSELGRLASQVSIQLQDFDRALGVARRIAARSDDFQDHVWLGQLASLIADQRAAAASPTRTALLDEAEAAFRRAIALAPEVAGPWVALISFLTKQHDLQSARDTIRQAESKMTSASAPLALAYCYEQLDDMEEAESRYLSALKSATDRAEALQAICEFYWRSDQQERTRDYLIELTNSAQATTEDVRWARRGLAMVELSLGEYENLGKAKRLIDQNLGAASDSVPDLRARALVLAAGRTAEDRRAAIKTWKRIFELVPSPTIEDRLRLAELHEVEHNWAEAARQLRAIMASPDLGQRYDDFLAVYISGLLRNNEVNEGKTWWNVLQNRAPNSWTTVSLQAEILTRDGKHDQSRQRLMGWLDNIRSSDASSHVDRFVPVVAGRLEGLAIIAKQGDRDNEYLALADQMLRQHAGSDHGWALAMYLVRQDRVGQALKEAASRSMAKKNSDGCLRLVEFILTTGPLDPEDRQQARQLLAAIHGQQGRTVRLLLAIAKLRLIAAEWPSAERAYREVLRDDADNVIALNNLAVVLSAQNKELAEAERLIDLAIRTAGPRADLLDTRAVVRMSRGAYGQALQALSKALASEEDPAFYLHQAVAFLKSGRSSEARAALQRANELGLQPEEMLSFEREMHQQLLAALR